MIRPATEAEWEYVCRQIASISPWTVLGIRGDELVHGLRVDPLRKLFVWEDGDGAAVVDETAGEQEEAALVRIGGAIILRAAAEVLFFRGFGEVLAARHGVAWPCEWADVPDGGYIGSLAVFEGQTGRGIGQQLIDAAHDFFRADGYAFAYLMVSGFNPRARAFYERNGYRRLGHLDDCIRPGNREYLMEKDLSK